MKFPSTTIGTSSLIPPIILTSHPGKHVYFLFFKNPSFPTKRGAAQIVATKLFLLTK